ncbi:MAG: hypothetical protein ACJ75F_12145 [Flavisolibacter sp.]|jgi:hypothetical protein
MKRFFYKWFIAALIVVLSLSAFSFMAYKKTRMMVIQGKASTCTSREDRGVMPWGNIQFPAISLR